ncbi:hypothetical protein DA01_03490 [Dehalococcoides mccartyi]|uniref:Phosphoadenosine phosphosulphate reductase domain-containing protein n=1 Tax=Dehalococcoides mccartyi TaxID=61435 RepID=A0A0V8M3Y1_9CHLR|nr:hypothetical protein [Dehalococcoides mccartyi]KSV18472.1 hypothetical protein DA01_03490 [Dehalococcoides mccartyi]
MGKFTVLSLGAGVQSTTILLMAIKGQLPKPDIAIFADTGAESQATYTHLAWLTKLAGENSIPVITVKHGDLMDDYLNAIELGTRFVTIPVHCVDKNGKKGMLRRQCTGEYKILPIRREIRRWLCVKPHERIPAGAIDFWVGISTDELRRLNGFRNDPKWLKPTFPLIQIKSMSRQDCLNWLAYHYSEIIVPRSSCVVCPFHSDMEWRDIYGTQDWETAVQYDDLIRTGTKSQRTQLYLHGSLKRLAITDLRTPEDFGQLVLPSFKFEKHNLFANIG